MATPTGSDWEGLVRDLARRVQVFAPDWTDWQDSDPGITMAEVIAFLAEDLLDRPGRSQRATTRLSRVVNELNDKVAAIPCARVPGLTRNRYAHGRLLSVADLELEQDYNRGKQRRHNLLLHGIGIVSGLDVAVASGRAGGEPHVTVSPGLAIGPDGEELLLCERTTVRLASRRSSCFVTLRLLDRLVDLVPTAAGDEASRVEEVVEVGVLEDVPAAHLALARLQRAGRAWRVDATFKAPHLDR